MFTASLNTSICLSVWTILSLRVTSLSPVEAISSKWCSKASRTEHRLSLVEPTREQWGIMIIVITIIIIIIIIMIIITPYTGF